MLVSPDEVLTAAHVVYNESGAPQSSGFIDVGQNGDAPTEMSKIKSIHLGHVVSEASSGIQGLDTLRCHGRDIDLVITDYAMPGMTGIELTRCIQSSYPNMAVVLASGYADIADLADRGALPRLAKRFPQAELEAVIALAVARGDGPGSNVAPLRSA